MLPGIFPASCRAAHTFAPLLMPTSRPKSDHVVHHRHVEDRRNEPVADALYLVQPRLMAEQGRYVLRLDGHDLHVRAALLEELAHPLERPSAADPGDEGGDVAGHLPPELDGRLLVVAARVVGVLELLGDVDPRIGGGHLRDVFHGPGDSLLIRRQDELCPEGPDELLALLAHALGHDDADVVALEPAHQRHADARVAGRGLDDDGALVQLAVALGPFEHRQGDAVLDAPAGVEELGLGEHVLVPQPQQGRVSDQAQYVVGQHSFVPLAGLRARRIRARRTIYARRGGL